MMRLKNKTKQTESQNKGTQKHCAEKLISSIEAVNVLKHALTVENAMHSLKVLTKKQIKVYLPDLLMKALFKEPGKPYQLSE